MKPQRIPAKAETPFQSEDFVSTITYCIFVRSQLESPVQPTPFLIYLPRRKETAGAPRSKLTFLTSAFVTSFTSYELPPRN